MTVPVPPIAAPLKKTALNAAHRALKAKMVDFGGWDMPVEYGGLIAEHMAVRTGVGLFDVSHMGEIHFRGPGSLAAVQQITMNDASRLKDGQAQYSALLTPEGAFVDDILVHRLSENDYLLVVNAGTTDKDYAWIRRQVGGWPGIHISDYSSYYSQLAVQGPRALETLQKLTKVDLAAIRNYWFTWGEVAGVANVLIARSGYTGEDGFEIYLPVGRGDEREGVERAAGGGAWSSGFAPAGWARATRCAWRRECPSTATKSPTRSTSSRPATSAGSSWTRANSLAARLCWPCMPSADRRAGLWLWRWSSAALPATGTSYCPWKENRSAR